MPGDSEQARRAPPVVPVGEVLGPVTVMLVLDVSDVYVQQLERLAELRSAGPVRCGVQKESP
jgi:hypothetical protein